MKSLLAVPPDVKHAEKICAHAKIAVFTFRVPEAIAVNLERKPSRTRNVPIFATGSLLMKNTAAKARVFQKNVKKRKLQEMHLTIFSSKNE
jgi:type IV pilus biogenesis protein CpaD/CtpE